MKAKNEANGLTLARTKAKISRTDLASRVGASYSALYAWERGAAMPGGPARILLAAALGVDVAEVNRWFERDRESEVDHNAAA